MSEKRPSPTLIPTIIIVFLSLVIALLISRPCEPERIKAALYDGFGWNETTCNQMPDGACFCIDPNRYGVSGFGPESTGAGKVKQEVVF